VSGAGAAAGDPGSPGLAGGFPGFVEAWNQTQDQATPALHRAIARWLGTAARRGEHRLVLTVFRDAGKSTLVGLYCAWRLVLDPNLRILVLSADQALAAKMTRNVRGVIERHPAAGHLKPRRLEQWAADQLTVARSRNLRDPSLLARGIGTNITGSRADLVVCDDVEVPRTCDTPGRRAELRRRLRELDYVLVPDGTIIYIGTPHSFHSIYAEAAGTEPEDEAPFLDGFARLTLGIVDERGRNRWPERFTVEHVDRLRQRSGPVGFMSQMLLRPGQARDLRLDPARLLAYEAEIEVSAAAGRRELRIEGHKMVSAACWWDPAYGRPERGDSSVVAAVFLDEAGAYWLHAIRYLTSDPGRADLEDEASQQCRGVAEFLRANEQPSITVETNGLGRFLPSLLRAALRREGVGATVVEHTAHESKVRRILAALDPLLAARRLHAHRSVWRTPFIAEMRGWSAAGAGHDDGLDAVAGCIGAQPARLPAGPGGPTRRPDWRPGAAAAQAASQFRP
jgi:hypothetical protein